MAEDDRAKDIALAEYKEVVTQFRALTDIRFKLLTYLPLGTVAAAVLVPTTSHPVNQPAIAAFAFIVTLCIATYDKRNDQHYDELVSRAAELERELQIEHGSFLHRPQPWLKYVFGFVPVEHRWPIGLIYAAAASLWAYLFTAPLVQYRPGLGWLAFAAPAVVIACWLGLRRTEKSREEKLRKTVDCLMTQVLWPNDAPPDPIQPLPCNALRKNDKPCGAKAIPGGTVCRMHKLSETITAQSILGIRRDKAERRVAYHWKGDDQKPDPRAASTLLGAVIDLPARWIEDVWTGRR